MKKLEVQQLALRVPQELREQVERVAVAHSSSVAGAARFLLRRALEQLDVEPSARRAVPNESLRT